MKLYYSKGACSLVVRIIINELGLSSNYEAVDLKSKKTETGADYLQINPKGAVPALEINPKELLTENAVILQYLADHHGNEQLLSKTGMERYRTLEWLNFITTEIHKGFGPMFNPSFPQEVKEKIVIPNLEKKFSYVDSQIKNKFLMGENFTLPDAYLYVMLTWANGMKFNVKQWENLVRYFNELQKRPSIVTSLEEEGMHAKEIA